MSSKPVDTAAIPFARVNSDQPTPPYHQVELDLRRLMDAGVLLPNDLLPPENELAQVYGVGRQAMRMALSHLVSAGLLVRQAGRGTFVRAPVDRRQFHLDRSFTQQMAAMGMDTHSRVLRTATGIINDNAPAALLVKHGAPYFQLSRLRFGNDIPIGLQTTTLIIERCPNIEAYDFSKSSLHDLLRQAYHLVIARMVNSVNAASCRRPEAELLGITPGDPTLIVTTDAYLENGEIIEHTASQYRTDRYEYVITHTFVSLH